MTTTNGTAVNLTSHTVGGSGLTSVSASNGVDGIVLTNTLGNFAVNGTGTAGSGGTITGMSDHGVNSSNAAGLTLQWMNINSSANQGVLVSSTLSTASSVNVQNSSFTGNVSNALQTAGNGSGVVTLTVNANTFTNNNAALVAQTTAGGMVVHVTNNTSTFNQSNAFNIVRSPSATGAVDATVTGNVVGATGVPASGASCGGGCNGIQVTASGSNAFNLLLSGNTVREIDSVGIRVFAQQGSSSLNATITNNLVEAPDAGCLHRHSGAVGCAGRGYDQRVRERTGNTVTGGYPDRHLRAQPRRGDDVQPPGIRRPGTDLTAVQNFIAANNTVTSVTAQRKTTAPANQYSGGAACPTPAP